MPKFYCFFMKKAVLGLCCIAIFFSCEDKSPKDAAPLKQNLVQEDLTPAQMRDTIEKLRYQRDDYQYFDLDFNQDGKEFFERISIENPKDWIITQLMQTNITSDAKHPLIDYLPRRAKKFQINKIKVLNHRWIICDFSDGLDWGELLLKYYVNEDKSLEFQVLDQILYVSEQKP